MKNYVVSWSINGMHVYLDDENADERLVDIHFMLDEKITKEQKIELLIIVIKNL